METRGEFIAWCKKRAIVYLETGDLDAAYRSIMSDLTKHPETQKHIALTIGARLYFEGQLDTYNKMFDFINKVN